MKNIYMMLFQILASSSQVGLNLINFNFGADKMHLSPPVARAAVRSKAVVLLLLIYCLM